MADIGTKAYLGNIEVVSNGLFLGNTGVLINPFPERATTIPQSGLQFWLDPTTYTTGTKWYSKIGNATGSFTGNFIYSGSYFFNMTTSSVCTFNTTSSLNYGSQPNTLFAVGRSSGSSSDHHGRLIAGDNNWLMGTYGGGGLAGSTEYQRAYYASSNFIIVDTPYDTEWRVYTAVFQSSTSASFFVNGQWVAESTASSMFGFNNISINNGLFQLGTAGGGENTQADYGDIILYNRVLTKAEITEVYDVIKSKYGL